MKVKIVPTIIAGIPGEFDRIYKSLKGLTDWVQVDVMDGKFVPSHSNDFKLTIPKGKTKFEAHLMVENPEEWTLENYGKFDLIIANAERVKDPEVFIGFLRNKGKKVGFAINPRTSINAVKPFLDKIDRVLVMTVNPGRYGGKFLPETMKKVRALRKIFDGEIEVDGGQVPDVAWLSARSGADIIASGSFIMMAEDKKKAIKELKDAVKEFKMH